MTVCRIVANTKWNILSLSNDKREWLVQLDTPVQEWPSSVITSPPWGPIKANTAQDLPHKASSQSQVHRDLSIFSVGVSEGCVSLSALSYLFKKNKPQSSTCMNLPQLTAIFMFTPLKFNHNGSSASSPRWISCTRWEKTEVRSSKNSSR